jgi:hypothetical protein
LLLAHDRDTTASREVAGEIEPVVAPASTAPTDIRNTTTASAKHHYDTREVNVDLSEERREGRLDRFGQFVLVLEEPLSVLKAEKPAFRTPPAQALLIVRPADSLLVGPEHRGQSNRDRFGGRVVALDALDRAPVLLELCERRPRESRDPDHDLAVRENEQILELDRIEREVGIGEKREESSPLLILIAGEPIGPASELMGLTTREHLYLLFFSHDRILLESIGHLTNSEYASECS